MRRVARQTGKMLQPKKGPCFPDLVTMRLWHRGQGGVGSGISQAARRSSKALRDAGASFARARWKRSRSVNARTFTAPTFAIAEPNPLQDPLDIPTPLVLCSWGGGQCLSLHPFDLGRISDRCLGSITNGDRT